MHPVRALTLGKRDLAPPKSVTRRHLRLLPISERPQTRLECETGPRPCPFVSCQFHLYLDVGKKGSIKLNFPHLEPDELVETCVLDVADRGGATLEEVADFINLTRERVRQIEEIARGKLHRLEFTTDLMMALFDGEGR